MAGRKAGIGKEVLWHAGPAAASAGWDAPFWSLRRTEPLLSMSIPGNEEARQEKLLTYVFAYAIINMTYKISSFYYEIPIVIKFLGN